jgi:hypothetical protein
MSRITTNEHYVVPVGLTCKNHPALRWSTKNIGAVCNTGEVEGRIMFSRTIFYEGEYGTECSCPASELVTLPKYDTMPDIAE